MHSASVTTQHSIRIFQNTKQEEDNKHGHLKRRACILNTAEQAGEKQVSHKEILHMGASAPEAISLVHNCRQGEIRWPQTWSETAMMCAFGTTGCAALGGLKPGRLELASEMKLSSLRQPALKLSSAVASDAMVVQ